MRKNKIEPIPNSYNYKGLAAVITAFAKYAEHEHEPGTASKLLAKFIEKELDNPRLIIRLKDGV